MAPFPWITLGIPGYFAFICSVRVWIGVAYRHRVGVVVPDINGLAQPDLLHIDPTERNTGAPMRLEPKLGKACAGCCSKNAANESFSAAVTTP